VRDGRATVVYSAAIRVFGKESQSNHMSDSIEILVRLTSIERIEGKESVRIQGMDPIPVPSTSISEWTLSARCGEFERMSENPCNVKCRDFIQNWDGGLSVIWEKMCFWLACRNDLDRN
jgi:hypothetical protein